MDDDRSNSDAFVCAVCLDLLYKPIVLACGHVSCFWCVHWSMSGQHESHCPICRHPYHHFPAICHMLHFLLQKMYPLTYKRREKHVLEDEKKTSNFSPCLDGLVTGEEMNLLSDMGQSSTISSEDHLSAHPSSIGKVEVRENSTQSELAIHAGSFETFSSVAVEVKKLHQRSSTNEQVSVADVLCAACQQLLFRPVVLNCGHVYCEACIIVPVEGTLACQVCQCSHPGGFPKVCLELDHFLEDQFSSEYALRKGTARLKEVHSFNGSPSLKATTKDFQFPTEDNLQWLAEDGPNFHAGVGCDSCGMYPIIGERYRCKDCTEKMGFDLCGDCYNTRSKLPGRFNQRHTPEHRFELQKAPIHSHILLRLFSGRMQNVYAALNSSAVAIRSSENAIPSNNDDENGSASPVTPTDTTEDQSDNQAPL